MRLPGGRRLTLYVPHTARARTSEAYPLLVLHDGQNLFEPKRAFVKGQHWRVGETVDALIAGGVIPPIVVCGVDHGDDVRIKEMTPTAGPDGKGGGARQYARMIVEEVLPMVRTDFSVRRDPAGTALGGSSLGGLVTLFIATEYPGVFGSAMAMSPSVWWDRRVILRRIARRAEALAGMRLWVDIGLNEGPKTIDDARRLAAILAHIAKGSAPPKRPARSKKRAPALEVGYFEVPDADHSERSWAARLGPALTFLFGR
jgi:enterochelin esterase-like enzyme